MESAEDSMKFRRQPEPVSVSLTGHTLDTEYWMRVLMTKATFCGDMVQRLDDSSFRIYPRAIND